jgi:inhibitor of KinA sporulation pathway (predicted exonuclease)
MKLTCLDLEFNQPSGKICQVGAVIGDTLNGEITHRLRIYVDPGEPIAQFITELCGITQDDINKKGVSLQEAYAQLKEFHLRHSTFINPVTWGGGDSQAVRDQLPPMSEEEWCFGRRWIDAKTVYATKQISEGRVLSGGLSTSMKQYGMKFVGRKHDAQDDAENTFRIYYEMLVRMRNR